MYSKNIQKLCKYCQWATQAIGVNNYMQCNLHTGFFKFEYSCSNFKYDIFKKDIHRLPNISSLNFTASDFAIE